MSHTQPWEIESWDGTSLTIIIISGEKIVCRFEIYEDRSEAMANAERIVACVNAFSGFDTEFIKKLEKPWFINDGGPGDGILTFRGSR